MSLLDHYRALYEHEKDCDQKMLAMLGSVPDTHRADARFAQAVALGCHLATCRENWLSHLNPEEGRAGFWQNPACDLAVLGSRFAAAERRWTEYLAQLDAARLAQDFTFIEGEESFSLPVEVQIAQLFGHASYHRGQIALLVDQLGGQTADTDYVDWWWANRREK